MTLANEHSLRASTPTVSPVVLVLAMNQICVSPTWKAPSGDASFPCLFTRSGEWYSVANDYRRRRDARTPAPRILHMRRMLEKESAREVALEGRDALVFRPRVCMSQYDIRSVKAEGFHGRERTGRTSVRSCCPSQTAIPGHG